MSPPRLVGSTNTSKTGLLILLWIGVAAWFPTLRTARACRSRVMIVLVTPLIALFSHLSLALLLRWAGIATPLAFGIRIWHFTLLYVDHLSHIFTEWQYPNRETKQLPRVLSCINNWTIGGRFAYDWFAHSLICKEAVDGPASV